VRIYQIKDSLDVFIYKFKAYLMRMYKVKSKTKIIEVMTLDDAMKSAKEMNELVTIEGNGIEIIGLFGVDFVLEGKCPDGSDYTWKKRRR
jgi:hypothetical protein